MSRQLWCPKCLQLPTLMPEDIANGFKSRIVGVKSHGFYQCDGCFDPIRPGDRIKCVTIWRGEENPPKWEDDYRS